VKGGASKLIVDVRRASGGSLDGGIALAKLFIPTGTLTIKETRGADKQTIASASGDGSISLPTTLLIDTGTSGAAELFASALVGNKRAELIGEHTIGRAAQQKLVRLPDGSGLWLTTTRFLTPSGGPLHEKGLEPTVAVDEPDVEFGQPAPTTDPILDKALELLGQKKAA
jgi:carboxyl-terminal processing protease